MIAARSIAAVLAAATLAARCPCPSPALAQPGDAQPSTPLPAKPPEALVWHIILPGELETAEVAQRFDSAVADANADGARFIIVELRGSAGRWDLARRLADTVRASSVSVAAYLPAARGGTGLAQWLVWLSAEQRYLAPGVTVRGSDDRALRTLAPADTAWGEVESALEALVGEGAPDAPDTLPRSLLFPSARVWALVSDSGLPPRLFTERPEPEPGFRAVLLVDRAPSGDWVVSITARTLDQMGFPGEEAATLGALRRAQGSAGLSTRELTIEASLRESRTLVGRAFTSADDTIERLTRTLELPVDRSVAREMVRRRGRDAVRQASEALERLEGVERQIQRVPELLRSPPPGQTQVGTKPATIESAWRRAIQSRVDRLSKIKADGQALVDR
jgi:hypothetical protein